MPFEKFVPAKTLPCKIGCSICRPKNNKVTENNMWLVSSENIGVRNPSKEGQRKGDVENSEQRPCNIIEGIFFFAIQLCNKNTKGKRNKNHLEANAAVENNGGKN